MTHPTEEPVIMPGRALDAVIAEKVFGARALNKETFIDVGTWTEGADLFASYPDAHRIVPRYSTDIAAAWEVVAEVQKRYRGWRFSLLGGDRPFGWWGRFFGGEDPTIGYPLSNGEAHADTPALAICLAALKAVES